MDTYLSKYEYFLIIDLEATCCEKQSISRREMETIEIGAVMVEAATLTVVDEFMTFIKPVRHPKLTPFCTKLTSIAQSDVDQAPTYPDAIKQFKEWLYQYESFLFCSWGDYDKGQFEQDCQFHGIPYPMASEHVNIKKRFSTNQNLKKKYGMAGALKISGLQLEGNHHRGIDDAKNMAKLMPFILGKQKLPKQNYPKGKRTSKGPTS